MDVTGRWRIAEMDPWDLEAVDLLGPADARLDAARGAGRCFRSSTTQNVQFVSAPARVAEQSAPNGGLRSGRAAASRTVRRSPRRSAPWRSNS